MAPSNGSLRTRLTVLALVGLLFAGAHLALEATARYAESRLGAYLWKEQDYLRLFSPAYHAGRGAGRLFIYGPSEAREGLLPEEIEHVVPDLKPYQNAQSIGTIEDGLVALNYIELAYGRAAVPDEILVGITTRFIANIRMQRSPLFEGIKKYSPHFTLEEGTHPPTLVPKSTLDATLSRVRLLALQPDRYRRGMVAVGAPLVNHVVPSLSAYERVLTRPAKYLTRKIGPESDIRKWLTTPGNYWEAVHTWNPEADRGRITHDLQLLIDYTSRHGIRLYIVNLPEWSPNRDLYLPNRYEAYLDIVTSAIGDTPFLDLRTFLNDDEYYDEAHPTWDGGIRVSRRVAAFIKEHRERPDSTEGRP
ncbi:MAG: hypothetical protein ABL993_08880 [Vicinamibacterales bacterium]